MKVIQEREKRISELQRYEFSFKKIGEINQQYEKEAAIQKNLIQQLKSKNEAFELSQIAAKDHATQLERAVEHLRGKYEEARLDAKNLEQDFQESQAQIEEMKQTLVRGLKEAKDIKQYYQNLANEKSAAIQKTSYMQEHVRELTEELRKKDKFLDEQRFEIEKMKIEKDEFEKKIKIERAKHRAYENEIKEREESLTSFAEQIKTMQSRLKSTEETFIAKEANLVEAQQQFAKKAREVSRLIVLNDDYKEQITKLQNDLIETKAKCSELQVHLDSKAEQMKSFENQITLVEKKAFKIQEKYQELELQNRELKKIEDKHRQTQQLLASLGNVIGSPIGITQPIGMVAAEIRPPVNPVEVSSPKKKETIREQSSENTTLFDIQDPPTKFKKDFFE